MFEAFEWRRDSAVGTTTGPTNTIADVDGIRVGTAERVGDGWLSGVSVILARAGALAGVDVRGGGPATRETNALDPSGLVERIPGILLTGGSAYGLQSSAGVLAALAEQGLGVPTGPGATDVVPVVPAAAIYDLGRGGDFTAYPGADLGRAATRAALEETAHDVQQGGVGAGTGALAAELRGGVGSASAVLEGLAGQGRPVTVGAYVVLNAHGSAVDPRTGLPWGAAAELRTPEGRGEFGLRTPTPHAHAGARERWAREAAARQTDPAPFNTTLAVVATDAPLRRAELSRLAIASGAGVARAVRPAYTLVDGDTVFALGTGAEPAASDPGRIELVNRVLAAGADAVARAIVHALLHAATITTPAGTVSSYRDLYEG